MNTRILPNITSRCCSLTAAETAAARRFNGAVSAEVGRRGDPRGGSNDASRRGTERNGLRTHDEGEECALDSLSGADVQPEDEPEDALAEEKDMLEEEKDSDMS